MLRVLREIRHTGIVETAHDCALFENDTIQERHSTG